MEIFTAMYSYQELHSFFSKFLNLLHRGETAKLVLECRQGRALVDLHHAFTLFPQEPRNHDQQHGHNGRRQGPSRQRRRARRALARAATEAAKVSVAMAETATQTQISDVVAQTTNKKAEKVSQPCPPTQHLQEQAHLAVQAGPPPHQEQAAQADPTPLFHASDQTKSAPELSSTAVQISLSKPSNSSMATFNETINHPEITGEKIPQLDGLIENLPNLDIDQTFKCETCGKVFETEREFKNHDSFQFCCDDCGICFSTQIAAHFHELEEHSDSHYAKTYIPESTKLFFRSNQPRKI